MAIEKIITKIKEDGEKEARKILNEARRNAEEILEKEQIEIEKEKEKKLERGKKEIETKKNIIISSAKRNSRKKILETKEEIINKCFDLAKKELEELKGEKYKEIIKKQIEDGKKIIGEELIILPSREEDISMLSNLGLKIGEKRDAMGGVTLVSKDGKIRIDNTFDGILERLRDDIRIGTARILFQGD